LLSNHPEGQTDNMDREEYINDIDKLPLVWANEWTPDLRMLDFEGKKYSLTHATDRLLTNAHRADAIYYPENSIEAVISFYKMGGDVVELDLTPSKDGVLVLMHDGNLKRMTDWALKKGTRVNGVLLPESPNVSDWTLEELRQLNLREGNGGNNTPVTEFKIATLEEALRVCKNRMFIVPDKVPNWRYADISGVNLTEGKLFLFDAMKKADNYDSILISYRVTPMDAIVIQKYIYEKTEVVPYILARHNPHYPEYRYMAPTEVYDVLNEGAIPDTFAIQFGGTYREGFKTRLASEYEFLRDKVNIAGWTIGAKGDPFDGEKTWQEMYGLGYRMIMTNNYLELVKYSATICNFD